MQWLKTSLSVQEILGTSPEQGRREKFRAQGQKFRLGSLVSGTPKSHDEQKKVIASADVRISTQNQVMSKKSVIVSLNFGSTSSDEQNKVIASADVRISARNQKNHCRVCRPWFELMNFAF